MKNDENIAYEILFSTQKILNGKETSKTQRITHIYKETSK